MKVDEKPSWLRVRGYPTEGLAKTRALNRELHLHTVCDSAHCPNIGECWRTGSATYMIMGELCTRHCGFCAVQHGKGCALEPDEPERVAQAISRSGLRYVVITSVTRDDLPDGGASVFAETVRAIRRSVPHCRVELLIPDLNGDPEAVRTVVDARPDVLGHNLEVVRSLQTRVRDRHASYDGSLEVLALIKRLAPGMLTKSSLMLGLGETDRETCQCLKDLSDAGVDIITLGQYLRPGPDQLPVQRYLAPEEFQRFGDVALGMDFRAVVAGPLVRSSYKAIEAYESARGG